MNLCGAKAAVPKTGWTKAEDRSQGDGRAEGFPAADSTFMHACMIRNLKKSDQGKARPRRWLESGTLCSPQSPEPRFGVRADVQPEVEAFMEGLKPFHRSLI